MPGGTVDHRRNRRGRSRTRPARRGVRLPRLRGPAGALGFDSMAGGSTDRRRGTASTASIALCWLFGDTRPDLVGLLAPPPRPGRGDRRGVGGQGGGDRSSSGGGAGGGAGVDGARLVPPFRRQRRGDPGVVHRVGPWPRSVVGAGRADGHTAGRRRRGGRGGGPGGVVAACSGGAVVVCVDGERRAAAFQHGLPLGGRPLSGHPPGLCCSRRQEARCKTAAVTWRCSATR